MKASAMVGSRELKARLGTHLRRVKEGGTLIVTERGRPVAEIRPITREEDPVERRLDEMAARGELTRGNGRPMPPFRPIKVRGRASLSRAIIEDRRKGR